MDGYIGKSHGVMNNMESWWAGNLSYSCYGVHAVHPILPGPGKDFWPVYRVPWLSKKFIISNFVVTEFIIT
jgi:hypothetical protein